MSAESIKKLSEDFKAQACSRDQRATVLSQINPRSSEALCNRRLAKVDRKTADALSALELQYKIGVAEVTNL